MISGVYADCHQRATMALTSDLRITQPVGGTHQIVGRAFRVRHHPSTLRPAFSMPAISRSEPLGLSI